MRRMWQFYGLAWLAYSILVCFVVQIDGLSKGHFDFTVALQSEVSTVPAALMLALVWPLTGYIERKDYSAFTIAIVHILFSLVFGLCWHLLVSFFMQNVEHMESAQQTRSLSAYIWPFLYSLMMYGVVASIFHTVRSTEATRQQALAVSQAQSLLVVAELASLRNKLNPHFLFNTLHSIIALMRKDGKAAEAALFRFSDMLRYVLDTEKGGNAHVTLDEELNFVRDYLNLEALRLGNRLHVEWVLDSEAANYCVPALSIQPLVENSIKHAFNPRSQPGRLLIKTRLRAMHGQFEIIIRDDGPGADMAQLQASNGIGVKTVERRLQLEYGARAGFQVNTAPGQGFEVVLTIPLTPA
ncbi:sensor histidine kinase [Undibacterium sp. TJN19]|uniref:sensor histidine kinase n=1 Tax=Undibacterium sp. TJN19 TaxID=3413055 RepID=UPI003BF1C6F4